MVAAQIIKRPNPECHFKMRPDASEPLVSCAVNEGGFMRNLSLTCQVTFLIEIFFVKCMP